MRQGSSVRPLNPVYRTGLVIPWPWAPQESDGDDEETSSARRTLSELQRWLPTAIFCAVLIGIIALVLVVRAIIGTASAGSAAIDPANDLTPAVQVAEVQPPAPPAPVAPQIRFTSRPVEATYTVVAGDSLSAIAQRYNSTTAALRGINNLPDDAILRVGQRLILP
jgi:hypothetical protein